MMRIPFVAFRRRSATPSPRGFLVEIQQTILDHIMALHDQLLSKKIREATNAFETRYRRVRRQSKRGLAMLIQTGKTLLDPNRPSETTLATLLQEIDAAVLRQAVAICDERQHLEERGEIDALRARYPGLRRYLPAFFALPFRSEPGSEAVLAGLAMVRQLDTGTRTTVPAHAPRRRSEPGTDWIACPGCATSARPNPSGHA